MLFVMMLFTLQGFYWFVGKRASAQVEGEKDYFLANRQVKLLPLLMTFLATQVGGGVVLGASEEAYRYGWPVLFYPLGGALGLMLLGAGLGRKLASFNVSTVAELFEVVYGSKALRKFASMLSIVSLFLILIAQVIGSRKFLVSMGMSNPYLFVGFWALIIYYTAKGGLKAVISTDLVQAAFFSGVFLFCLAYVWGVTETTMPTLFMGHLDAVSDRFVGWLILPMLFMVIGQDMGQRCFAGATPKIVSQACIGAGVVSMIVCMVPLYLGIYAASIGIQVPEGGSVLMTTVATLTNPFVTALVGCAVLAAVLSTATSLINAISSNLAEDFSWSRFQRISPLRRAQMMTFLISSGAVYAAFQFTNIVDLLMMSYDLSLSCLCVPLFFALFKRQGSHQAAMGAVLCGIAGFLLFRIYPVPFSREIAAMLISLAGFGIGGMIARFKGKAPELVA
jgi:SSS family solute:Na+ symporter